MRKKIMAACAILMAWMGASAVIAQAPVYPAPQNGGLRPIDTGNPVLVPINPATQSGIYPSAPGGTSLDPYARTQGTSTFTNSPVYPQSGTALPPAGVANPSPVVTVPPPPIPNTGSSVPATNPNAYVAPGVYGAPATSFGTPPPAAYTAPGAYSTPGVYPNSSPSSLYPTAPPNPYGAPPNYSATYNAWNPQGSVFTTTSSTSDFIQLFQGPRFRYAYLYGNNDADALSINDFDASIAVTFPQCCCTGQPYYVLPSFSLHLWDGPKPPSTADLPSSAYSAFIDSGLQSDPLRVFSYELGVRFGVFTDFDTFNSDSTRILGRAIGRVRTTPDCTLKLGVLYLDRNRIKLLPAFGLLWQPNPNTRFDFFFPEPKLSSYLSTFGTNDTWWYAAGYLGGGSWTVKRTSGAEESVDINDLRIALGLEFGQNKLMQEGRRNGFVEIGYVFDRELYYKSSSEDNMNLQDTIIFRAGIGY